MTAALIVARNATKVLPGIAPVTLVRDLNLSIGARELIAITGPSGSGKSSLLYMLGLLDLPSSGDILVNNRSTTAMSAEERAHMRLTQFGFVFQFHFLLPEFSITENVALPMRALGKLSQAAISARAMELLNSLDLGARPDMFS
ncbi:ATP-binding cassette domain-containing protein [Bradyrhizobium sp. 2S1]|uniref:ATP-binding cassette domain-containing protein n=1 Tax=Bradyrhizobium sp. 2S1 TaxID=1404429 RepID=UPI00140D9BC5|nr:ATP-binding cassette domain-containing protein [Bradyrhizobium sp. 2S1]MCK7664681.1 ATP-binding cassette domain-containing protein [Bradyrhizobium sp. 2S1]